MNEFFSLFIQRRKSLIQAAGSKKHAIRLAYNHEMWYNGSNIQLCQTRQGFIRINAD